MRKRPRNLKSEIRGSTSTHKAASTTISTTRHNYCTRYHCRALLEGGCNSDTVQIFPIPSHHHSRQCSQTRPDQTRSYRLKARLARNKTGQFRVITSTERARVTRGSQRPTTRSKQWEVVCDTRIPEQEGRLFSEGRRLGRIHSQGVIRDRVVLTVRHACYDKQAWHHISRPTTASAALYF
jgi:hypothetical protein